MELKINNFYDCFDFRIEYDDEIEKDVSRANLSQTSQNESCVLQ